MKKHTLENLDRQFKGANKKSKIQQAIEHCQLMLQSEPTNAELHITLGDLYLKWHLDISNTYQYIDEAITEYQRALETYINSAEIYFKIGQAQYFKGDLDKAINYLNTAINKDPHLGKAYYLLAETYTKRARFLEAVFNAKKAIKNAPFTSSSAHSLLEIL